MNPNQAPCLIDESQMGQSIQRLAREIAAELGSDANFAVLGIRTRGLPLAERLVTALKEILGRDVPLGTLDITLYRDDILARQGVPQVRPTEIPFRLQDATVLLVDDVLFSGRTIRAALDAMLDHGRPKRVKLAVLVDRGGRELPIQADFVGMRLEVPADRRVIVKLREIDGQDGIYLGQGA